MIWIYFIRVFWYMNMVYKNEVIIKCSLHDIKMYTRNLRVKQQYLSKPKS